jgi:Tfp pilus assembly protein PilZ
MAIGTEDLNEKSKIPGTFTFERQITVAAELTNLSPNGAFIATQESFSHGDVVDCQVNAVDSPLAVQGRVTRRTEGGIGIAFQNVTVEDNARLLALLANLSKEQGALV